MAAAQIPGAAARARYPTACSVQPLWALFPKAFMAESDPSQQNPLERVYRPAVARRAWAAFRTEVGPSGPRLTDERVERGSKHPGNAGAGSRIGFPLNSGPQEGLVANMFFNRQKPMVGLDIGSSSIKLVQAERTGSEVRLKDFGIAELLPEAIVDGEIMDRQLVVETIQNL